MSRNLLLKSTWSDLAHELRDKLSAGALSEALGIVDETRSDAWLGVCDSDYILYAVAALGQAGRYDDALALVRVAKRFGFPRLWYFWPATVATTAPAVHALLAPILAHDAIMDFMRASFSPTVVPWGFDLASTPFCWGEEMSLGRSSAKCAVSGARLVKGEAVYGFRYFNGSFDIPTELAVARLSALATSEAARVNRARFESDSYELASFAFKIGYSHPLVNAFWHDLPAFDLHATVTMIATPEVRPADSQSVIAGANGTLVDLLWVLVKSGHLPTIMTMLPELPRHFSLLLALFARPRLRLAIAEHLGCPDLPRLYDLVSNRTWNAKSAKAVAELGAVYPEVRDLFAESLALYEYHRYSNYRCSPNWFFQDFGFLVRGRGRHFMHLFASRPELVESLGGLPAEPSRAAARR